VYFDDLQWRTQEFFSWGWGVQQIQLKTEGREDGDRGELARWSGVPLNLQMNETCVVIMLLWMCIPWNREFGTALSKRQDFKGGGGIEPHPYPLGMPLKICKYFNL
jgi:hypothetical protein